MKNIFRTAFAAAAIVPLLALFLVSGCDSADDYTVDVTPPFVDLHEGSPRVTLTATGWSDYTWTLSNKDIGFLSATHGESVVYTAAKFPETPATTNTTVQPLMQYVTVAARNVVTTSGGTNKVSNIYTGEAVIRHIKR